MIMVNCITLKNGNKIKFKTTIDLSGLVNHELYCYNCGLKLPTNLCCNYSAVEEKGFIYPALAK